MARLTVRLYSKDGHIQSDSYEVSDSLDRTVVELQLKLSLDNNRHLTIHTKDEMVVINPQHYGVVKLHFQP